jgi:hypothetical protein
VAQRVEERRGQLADEFDEIEDVAPDAVRSSADLLDHRTARRWRIEVLRQHLRIELVQQRLERRSQVDHFERAFGRATQQFDEQRGAGAVAVFDTRGIDDDVPLLRLGHRLMRGLPDARERHRVETTGDGDAAATVRQIANGK